MRDEIALHMRNILELLGYDLDNQNFKGTPLRVAKWLMEYQKNDEKPIKQLDARFPTEFNEMIIVKDINFVALCAHHMLPFRGVAHVGYVGEGKHVVGLSKLSRLVRACAQRLTIQEDITREIAETLQEALQPKGVMVVLESEHMCMTLRGVKDPNAITVTSVVRGCFLNNAKGSKDEFLRLIGK